MNALCFTGCSLLSNGPATKKCERVTADAKVAAMESSTKYPQVIQTHSCICSGANIYHSQTHKPHASSSQGTRLTSSNK